MKFAKVIFTATDTGVGLEVQRDEERETPHAVDHWAHFVMTQAGMLDGESFYDPEGSTESAFIQFNDKVDNIGITFDFGGDGIKDEEPASLPQQMVILMLEKVTERISEAA